MDGITVTPEEVQAILDGLAAVAEIIGEFKGHAAEDKAQEKLADVSSILANKVATKD